MNPIRSGFRRLVAYTVGGVVALAFVLFLQALFSAQGQPTASDSPIATPDADQRGSIETDPFGVTFLSEEGDDLEPAWSPDGRSIAYVSLRDNVYSLFVRDLSTNATTPIATDAWHPIWSPDGTHLAYTRSNPEGLHDTFVTDPQGNQHVKVNDTPDAGGAIWSRDSQSILLSTRSGELHVASLNGASARVISIENVWALSLGSVSPDGTQVLGSGSTRDPPGPTGLISIDIQTGRISGHVVDDPLAGRALWSPDGQSIAYGTLDERGTSLEIVRVVPAQGGEPHTIINPRPGFTVSQLAWSPDSRFVAYVDFPQSSVIDGGEVYVVWADGSRSVPLLPGSAARAFSWSPDGTQIAVSMKNGDQFDIALLRADEASLLARLAWLEAPPTPSDPAQVTYLPVEGNINSVAWSPDGRYILLTSTQDNGQTRRLLKYDLMTNEVTQLASVNVSTPIWSPDATHLIYQQSDPQGWPDLYLTDSNWIEHIRVNDVPNVTGAVWSPDSRSIVFSTYDGKIHIFSLDTHTLRTIPVEGADPLWATSLSPDGTRLLAHTRWDGPILQGLIGIDLQSGEVTQLPIADPKAGMGQWSPNGQYIAYVTYSVPSQGSGVIRVVPTSGGDPRTLTTRTAIGVYQLAWSPDSRYFAYTIDAMGSLQAYVSEVDAFEPIPLLPDLRVSGLSWSPDGSQIALSVDKVWRDGQSEIAIIRADEASLLAPLEPPKGTPPPAPPMLTPFPSPSLAPTRTPPSGRDFYRLQRLTNDATGNYRPAVSPDGRSVAFASERDGNWDIYLLDLATGAETRLTDDPLNDMAPSWSPDGTRIAYQHNIPDSSGPVLVERIVMNGDGSGKTVVASGAVWIGNEAPAWSPASDQIAFSDGKGVTAVNIADKSEVVRFTPSDASAYFAPVWIDGKQVAFTHDGRLAIGDVSSGTVSVVEGIQGFVRLPLWSSALSRLGYFGLEGGSARLVSVRPDGADPYTLAQLNAGLVQHAAWSPNGRFIAYYADDSVHLAIAWSDQYRDRAPLFTIPGVASGLSDLVGVSWLPDESGFVFVASFDGQPDLYLATLNEDAVQAFLAIMPIATPTPAPPFWPSTPNPESPDATPNPALTSTPALFPAPTDTPVIPPGKTPYWLLLSSQAQGAQIAVSGQHVWMTGLFNIGVASTDGGATWSAARLPAAIRWIEPSPHFETDRIVFAAGSEGVFRSTDGGATWQPALSGLSNGFNSLSMSGGTVFASSADTCEMFRSDDGGSSWTTLNVVAQACSPARVVASPTYATDRVLYVLTNDRGLWRSRDGGGKWEQIILDTQIDLAIDPSDPSTVYIAGAGGNLLRSGTTGDGWVGPLLPAAVTAVAVAPNGTVIAGATDGRVYESVDRGATWAEISTFSGDPIRDIAATDGVIYVLAETGLLGGYREGAPVPATPTPTAAP